MRIDLRNASALARQRKRRAETGNAKWALEQMKLGATVVSLPYRRGISRFWVYRNGKVEETCGGWGHFNAEWWVKEVRDSRYMRWLDKS